MKVVVDAGPIIALAKTGHLNLLPRLFDEVVVPQSVMAEVAGPGEGRPGTDIARQSWAHVRSDPAGQQQTQKRRRLGDGEAEAIAIARQDVEGTYLLIDDDTGLKTAARFGVQTLRTGALLVMAVEAGLVTATTVEGALSTLRRERYMSAAVERAILALLRETVERNPE